MGYLNGLPKNPVYGWCTSSTNNTLTDANANYTIDELIGGTIEILEGTGQGQTRTVSDNTATVITVSTNWTTNPDTTSKYKVSNYDNWGSADYGFWAREGDHLVIDGEVRYDNGDWIIQHDGSLRILDSADKEIIRLGTDTGDKGLFIYNTSGVQLARFISDEIYIGVAGNYLQYTVAGGLVVEGTITTDYIEAVSGTIGNWDITANTIEQTFGTDHGIMLRTSSGQESIYFYDESPATNAVAWLGMGKLYDGSSWTGEEGIGMVVYNGSTYDKYFWLSNSSNLSIKTP